MNAYRAVKDRLLTPVEMLASQWVSQVDRALGLPRPLHAVRYEDLVTNPQSAIDDLFTFCGLAKPTGLDAVLANDSQAGTTLAQSAVRDRPVHLDEAELIPSGRASCGERYSPPVASPEPADDPNSAPPRPPPRQPRATPAPPAPARPPRAPPLRRRARAVPGRRGGPAALQPGGHRDPPEAILRPRRPARPPMPEMGSVCCACRARARRDHGVPPGGEGCGRAGAGAVCAGRWLAQGAAGGGACGGCRWADRGVRARRRARGRGRRVVQAGRARCGGVGAGGVAQGGAGWSWRAVRGEPWLFAVSFGGACLVVLLTIGGAL